MSFKREETRMRWLLVLMTLAVLAGCTSAQEVCTKKGYSPGTDAYASCMKMNKIPD